MEPRFEIRCTFTHKMLAENVRKYGVGPRIPTVIITAVFFLAMILYSVRMGTWDRIRKFVMILIAIETVVFFLPHILTWLSCRARKKQNGGILPEAIITFADRIVYREDGRQLEFAYTDLIGAVRLKHSYKLRFTNRRTLLLEPNSFTKGTFEELKQFLRTQRPNLAFPE